MISPHVDRLWRENSNGILYIDLFIFYYYYYDYFFAMVASGHLSAGALAESLERERECVCVYGPLLPVTADDEAAGTWNAVLHTDTHTHTRKYVRTVEPNEKEQWAERASGWLA